MFVLKRCTSLTSCSSYAVGLPQARRGDKMESGTPQSERGTERLKTGTLSYSLSFSSPE